MVAAVGGARWRILGDETRHLKTRHDPRTTRHLSVKPATYPLETRGNKPATCTRPGGTRWHDSGLASPVRALNTAREAAKRKPATWSTP